MFLILGNKKPRPKGRGILMNGGNAYPLACVWLVNNSEVLNPLPYVSLPAIVQRWYASRHSPRPTHATFRLGMVMAIANPVGLLYP